MNSNKNSAVLTVSSTITIDAPHHVVRDVLLDFASYSQWNKEFISQMVLLDAQHKPLEDQHTPLAVGSWFRITCCLPNTSDTRVNDELITELDADAGTLAWRYEGYWGMITAEREQTLHAMDDGTTVYKTYEDFWGPVAWYVKWTAVPNLQAAFDAFGRELKARAESLKR